MTVFMKNDNGYITVLVFILLATIAILGSSVSRISSTDLWISRNEGKSKASFYVAEGGNLREAMEIADGAYGIDSVHEPAIVATESSPGLPTPRPHSNHHTGLRPGPPASWPSLCVPAGAAPTIQTKREPQKTGQQLKSAVPAAWVTSRPPPPIVFSTTAPINPGPLNDKIIANHHHPRVDIHSPNTRRRHSGSTWSTRAEGRLKGRIPPPHL